MRALEDVALAVEDALLLARGDRGADAGRRVEPGEPGAAGAHALDQRALRHHLAARSRRPSPCSLIGAGHRRRADVAADQLPDLLLVGEDVERGRPAGRRVADDRQVPARRARRAPADSRSATPAAGRSCAPGSRRRRRCRRRPRARLRRSAWSPWPLRIPRYAPLGKRPAARTVEPPRKDGHKKPWLRNTTTQPAKVKCEWSSMLPISSKRRSTGCRTARSSSAGRTG